MPSVFGIMLATHLKKGEPGLDLKGPLSNYIKATYSDQEAREAEDDLVSIQKLRAEVLMASANASTPGMRDVLIRYYRALMGIANRFPISQEKGHANVHFTWYDAFRPSKKVSQTNIHFEASAVIFNLAAVLNQAGLSCDRTVPDGLQHACKFFQEAAGAFAALREGEAGKVDSPRPADITPEALNAMERLMLAQAQECVYLKAVLDKKSSTLVSRLAKQTQQLYEEVSHQLISPALAPYFDKAWAAHTQLKSSAYEVETLAQAAKGLRAEDKVTVEVSVLREAFSRCQGTKKLAKAVSADMVDSVNRVQEAITVALNKAEKENNSIYLQRVPNFADAGVSVQGALVVKSLLPALEGPADNLFSSLVPDSAAKALSRYSEMVDDVMRKQRDVMAAATDTARIKLKEWELPDTIEALDPRSAPNSLAANCLPSALLAELEEVQSVGGPSHLTGILAEIGEVRRGVDAELASAGAALEGEATEDNEMRTMYGDKWRVSSSATSSKPYWDRISQYRTTVTQAGDSDAGIMKRLSEKEPAFRDLAIDTAALKMPRLQAPLVATTHDDPAQLVAGLRRNLEALQAMSSERAGMEEALKDLKVKDNILPKLMACNPQSHETLFATELRKYDAVSTDIGRNAAAQTELLNRVEEQNRAFRTVFDVVGWREACGASSAKVRETVATFRELVDHCAEGLRFYLGMQDVARKCRQEAEDWAFTRRVQRDETKQEIERRLRADEDEVLARRMAMAKVNTSGPPPPPGAPPGMYPHAPSNHTPPPPPHQPAPYQSGAHSGSAPPPPPHSDHSGTPAYQHSQSPQYPGPAPPGPQYSSQAPSAPQYSQPPPPSQAPQYGGHQQQYGAPSQQYGGHGAPQPPPPNYGSAGPQYGGQYGAQPPPAYPYGSYPPQQQQQYPPPAPGWGQLPQAPPQPYNYQ